MIEYMDLREVDGATLLGWLSHLAENLRPGDLDEIEASSDLPPLASLVASVRVTTQGWVILADGEPVCIFGVAPSGIPEAGIVWMMGTPRMDERRVALNIARSTAPYVDRCHDEFAVLWNFIDARNAKSMKWLSWSGFETLEYRPSHGPKGLPFFLFGRIIDDV